MAETHVFSHELSPEDSSKLLKAAATMISLRTKDGLRYTAGKEHALYIRGYMRRSDFTRDLTDPEVLSAEAELDDQHRQVDQVEVKDLDIYEARALGVEPGIWVIGRWTDPSHGSVVYTAYPEYAAFQVVEVKAPEHAEQSVNDVA